MQLTNFNKLVKQIISENSDITIKYNTFDYKFNYNDEKSILTCKFSSIDKSTNKLIFITVTIFDNGKYEFVVKSDTNKDKIYTDKEFMMSYYKDYQDFKHAYSIYKKDYPDNKDPEAQQEILKNEKNTIDGKVMPKIQQFNDVLANVDDVEAGTLIKTNGIAFTIKSVEDKVYKNLFTISFSFQNQNDLKSKTDLDNYDAICLGKINENFFKILNINLYDPEDLKNSTPVETMTESQFKDKFLTIYFALSNTMSKYLTQFQIDRKF